MQLKKKKKILTFSYILSFFRFLFHILDSYCYASMYGRNSYDSHATYLLLASILAIITVLKHVNTLSNRWRRFILGSCIPSWQGDAFVITKQEKLVNCLANTLTVDCCNLGLTPMSKDRSLGRQVNISFLDQ